MSEEDAGPLSPAMASAWGVRPPATRGPKPGMTLERIVAAAIAVADAEGLGEVSMHRVARELGSSAMSLYRYVGSKEELVAVMVDSALSPLDPADPGEDWRAGLAHAAWGLLRAMEEHPWSVEVPITGLPIGPRTVAWLEDALDSMSDTDLAEAEKASVAMMLSGYVRHHVMLMGQVQAALSAGTGSPDEAMQAYVVTMRRLTVATSHPALHRLLDAGVFARADPPDHEFAFGLERLLDGVGVLVDQRAG